MTLQELETLVKQIQDQVELNTLAINSISNRFSQYATLSQLYSTNSTTSAHSTSITAMQLDIANLQTSIGLVNKITKLLDVNIQGLAKDDLLQFDGDRWTNIKPSKLGLSGGSGSSTLEGLTDVLITDKADGQALVWSNTDNKWVNKTVSSGGSGGSGIDLDAEIIGIEKEYQVPNLTESVSEDENGILHITITNLSVTEDYEIDAAILEKDISEVKGEIVTEEMHAMNTFEEPDTVHIKEFADVKITEKGLAFRIPACSVLHLEVK